MNLPAGMKFTPTDEEAISDYLAKKANNLPLPDGTDQLIPTVNLYHHNPQELTATPQIVGSEEWYFFTEMEGSGRRPSRKAEGGFWKTTAKDKPVYDVRGSLIGAKRALDFHQDDKKRTEYKMHEYTLTSTAQNSNQIQMKYWVLNKIYINSRTKNGEECCETPYFSETVQENENVENNFGSLSYYEDFTSCSMETPQENEYVENNTGSLQHDDFTETTQENENVQNNTGGLPHEDFMPRSTETTQENEADENNTGGLPFEDFNEEILALLPELHQGFSTSWTWN